MVDIVYSADRSTKARFDIYEKSDWAKGYDVVIHDECSADVKEMPYVRNILKAHQEGVPAVNLHCAMHCYRTGTDDWFEFVGIHSTRHGRQEPIEVTYVDKEHPIAKGLEDWTTINEELYNNLRVSTRRVPLARGKQGKDEYRRHLGQPIRQDARVQHHAGPQQRDGGRRPLSRSRHSRPVGVATS